MIASPSPDQTAADPLVQPPVADLTTDAEQVERMRSRLRPEPGVDLSHIAWAPAPVKLGEGWDNTIWDVGSLPDGTPLALRVPRRRSALALHDREIAVMRVLVARADELPVRVPWVLATSSEASLGPWFPGATAAEAPAERVAPCVPVLARSLAAIHRPAPQGLEHNPVRGVPLAERGTWFPRDLARVDLPAELARRVRETWEAGLAADRWHGPELLLHGDPHPGNLVLPDDGRAPVLIDFGDTTAGDPASDLGGLLLYGNGEDALDEYRANAPWDGARDDGTWEALVARSRAWSASYALALLTAYAPSHGLGAISMAALRRL